jgi:hypothetical protein
MQIEIKYPCDNHKDRQEWIICDRQDKRMHLCYECYQELKKKEHGERNKK